LLPRDSISSVEARPEQRVLLGNPLVPIDMSLYHSWLGGLFKGIPTAGGDWSALPDSRIFIDAKGAPAAKRLWCALAELFEAGPPVVELQEPRVVTDASGNRSDKVLLLSYPRQGLAAAFARLADFASVVAAGKHLLFCSYWLERPE
jgi:hypothetical protein